MRQAGIDHQPHRGVDGGVRRRAQEQQLGCAQAQHLPAGRVGAVERPFDQKAQDLVDLAQAAQGGGQQQAHEGAVARIEAGEALMAGQRVVERLALVEARHQDVERDAPRENDIHCAGVIDYHPERSHP
jgi:hypothetical protein